MNHNVGTLDRFARGLGGLAMAGSPFVLALPSPALSIGLGATGVYLALTAVFGRCLGYRLMGRSTCAVR
ncbi:MAG: DUF2892 domain-containing protein [Polyangiales bacterium]